MNIEKAEQLGLCFGVRRAVELLKEAVTRYGEIETLGPLAHNRMLVEGLAELGVRPVHDLSEVRGRVLAVTTHGISPAGLSEIAALDIAVIDTTCPIVRKAQKTARELIEVDFDVLIFGEAEHSEVRGLLGYAAGRGVAALDTGQVEDWTASSSRLGVISQTTQTQSAFAGFAGRLVTKVGHRVKEIRIVNTLCQVTRRQQEAAVRLARRSELMLVIGGSSSANARHLVEICAPLVETHLVETVEDVDTSWFQGKQNVGVTAGASTPDEAVEALIARLMSL